MKLQYGLLSIDRKWRRHTTHVLKKGSSVKETSIEKGNGHNRVPVEGLIDPN